MDLSGPWESALVASGFDREQPAGWLLEGFLFYLPVQSMTDLLARTLTLAARAAPSALTSSTS